MKKLEYNDFCNILQEFETQEERIEFPIDLINSNLSKKIRVAFQKNENEIILKDTSDFQSYLTVRLFKNYFRGNKKLYLEKMKRYFYSLYLSVGSNTNWDMYLAYTKPSKTDISEMYIGFFMIEKLKSYM